MRQGKRQWIGVKEHVTIYYERTSLERCLELSALMAVRLLRILSHLNKKSDIFVRRLLHILILHFFAQIVKCPKCTCTSIYRNSC